MMKTFFFIIWTITLNTTNYAGQNSSTVTQQSPVQKSQFLRVKRSVDQKPLSLDTAIAKYQVSGNDETSLTVDLVAVVHVADALYYETLNKKFEAYDAVLYELIAPEGTRPKYGDKSTSNHPIGKLQQAMKNMLELSFQLSEINYTKSNFIHADFSPEQFSQSMKNRDESFVKMLFKMMLQSIVIQKNKGISDGQLILALMSPDRALSLKKLLATQFESLESTIAIFEGSSGSTIISERNIQAIKVLSNQITLKKKNIAIFYGAGHMPDLEKRLINDFSMELVNKTWLAAWDLTGK
ncbi:MAG: hypothetical protein ACI9N9_001604 [Enterobacterales bacterium]|jgi:hypothetical protein